MEPTKEQRWVVSSGSLVIRCLHIYSTNTIPFRQNLLKKHSKEHKLLAETLLEYETLTGEEVRDIILKGKKPDRPVVNNEGGGRVRIFSISWL